MPSIANREERNYGTRSDGRSVYLDPALYPRHGLNEERVQDYMEVMEAGGELPRIQISIDGRLIDGRHRLEAASRLGEDHLQRLLDQAEVVEGDGLVHAVIANIKHGEPLTRQEKQDNACRLLDEGYGVEHLAENVFGVPPQTVRRWTKDHRDQKKQERNERIRDLSEQGFSVREIAEKVEQELGISTSKSTVSRVLSQNEQVKQNGTLDDSTKDSVDERHEPPQDTASHDSESGQEHASQPGVAATYEEQLQDFVGGLADQIGFTARFTHRDSYRCEVWFQFPGLSYSCELSWGPSQPFNAGDLREPLKEVQEKLKAVIKALKDQEGEA